MNDKLKKVGNKILYEEGLLDILNTLGEAKIVGSFDLDLLVKPDIDITIGVDEYDIDKYFSVCNQIAKDFKPIRIKYLDQSVAKFEAFPFQTGYFLGINLEREAINWSIDCWLFTQEIFKERIRLHERNKKKLSDKNRELLMNIKESICENPKYRSADLYEAVLFEGVDSLQGFYDWYKIKYSEEFNS